MGSDGEPADWIVRILERIEIDGKPLREIEGTAQLLAPGPARPEDGLPAWWSHLEPAWAGNWQPKGPQSRGQRTGRAKRDILAAVCVDIHGRSLAWVSGTVLGLNDHEEFTKDGTISKDPRNARRYRDRGRMLLAALGAWPWAFAPSGKLTRNWREDCSFMLPLDCWVTRAIDDLRSEINRADRFLFALSKAGGDRGELVRRLYG